MVERKRKVYAVRRFSHAMRPGCWEALDRPKASQSTWWHVRKPGVSCLGHLGLRVLRVWWFLKVWWFLSKSQSCSGLRPAAEGCQRAESHRNGTWGHLSEKSRHRHPLLHWGGNCSHQGCTHWYLQSDITSSLLCCMARLKLESSSQ